MEISDVFSGDTLKAADLQGREHTVVIASVKMKQFDKGNKLIIAFQGRKKVLVGNKTNSNRIAYMYGTNTDNWIGKEITLYVDLVDFQGNTVEAIRVRPPVKRNGGQVVTDHGTHQTSEMRRPASEPERGLNDEIPF